MGLVLRNILLVLRDFPLISGVTDPFPIQPLTATDSRINDRVFFTVLERHGIYFCEVNEYIFGSDLSGEIIFILLSLSGESIVISEVEAGLSRRVFDVFHQ